MFPMGLNKKHFFSLMGNILLHVLYTSAKPPGVSLPMLWRISCKRRCIWTFGGYFGVIAKKLIGSGQMTTTAISGSADESPPDL